MPLVAPVMTATLPLSRAMSFSSLSDAASTIPRLAEPAQVMLRDAGARISSRLGLIWFR
jgi:hypothetical protein